MTFSGISSKEELFLLIFFIYLTTCIISSPLTNPLTSDGEIGRVIPDHFESRRTKAFHLFSPNKSYSITELNQDKLPSCNVELSLQWSENVGRPVLATPVVFPGTMHLRNKNIFLSSLEENIEFFEGDGSRPAGWPIRFPRSSFHASPLVFDIDGDGFNDIGVCDEAANLYWIRVSDYGQYLEDYHIQIPKLRVLRDWMDAVHNKENMNVYVALSRFPSHSGREGGGLNDTKTAKLNSLTAHLSTLARVSKRNTSSSSTSSRRRLTELDDADVTHTPDIDPLSEIGLGIDHGEEGSR